MDEIIVAIITVGGICLIGLLICRIIIKNE